MGFHSKPAPGIGDVAAEATVAMFQAYPAVGTMLQVENVNDNNTNNQAYADVPGQRAEITYGDLVKVRRWRQFGYTTNTGNGVWKLQYWDVVTDTWKDWVTGIPVRVTSDWSDFISESEVITTRIRLICTTVDDYAAGSAIGELEVIY